MARLPTRALGDSGLQVSVVGLGCNNFGRRIDLDGTREVVDAALAEGVTFFDTADVYGLGQSEEFLGIVLEGRRDQGEPAPAGARLSGRATIATDEQFELLDALEGYANERGISMIEVAIGALLARDVVSSVIAGATSPAQVRENAAAGRWTSTQHDLAALGDVLASADG